MAQVDVKIKIKIKQKNFERVLQEFDKYFVPKKNVIHECALSTEEARGRERA